MENTAMNQNNIVRFKSLVNKSGKKKRKCLKCEKMFTSENNSIRFCCWCKPKIKLYGVKAELLQKGFRK